NLLDDNINVISLRKEIGMVFQKPNPFPKSIYNNIAHALKYYGIKNKQKLDRIDEDRLKKVGHWEEVKYRLHESDLALSGGQQQCLCIARTIAMETKELILDEPPSEVYSISNGKIEALMIELKKDFSIIMV